MPDPPELDEDESILTKRLIRLFAGKLSFVRFADDAVTVVVNNKKTLFSRPRAMAMSDEELRSEVKE